MRLIDGSTILLCCHDSTSSLFVNQCAHLFPGDFAFDSITAVDRLTAQLLVGTFIALSGIVMINIFIALLSDTFQRVYDNAKANAVMQQANAILDAESLLGRRSRDAFRRFIQTKCSPLVRQYFLV